MAELILTDAEKKAARHLDWDDAALGKAVKKLALKIGDIWGEQALICTSCATLLACQAAGTAEETLTVELDGVIDKYDRIMDWRVTISKLSGGSEHKVGRLCAASDKTLLTSGSGGVGRLRCPGAVPAIMARKRGIPSRHCKGSEGK